MWKTVTFVRTHIFLLSRLSSGFLHKWENETKDLRCASDLWIVPCQGYELWRYECHSNNLVPWELIEWPQFWYNVIKTSSTSLLFYSLLETSWHKKCLHMPSISPNETVTWARFPVRWPRMSEIFISNTEMAPTATDTQESVKGLGRKLSIADCNWSAFAKGSSFIATNISQKHVVILESPVRSKALEARLTEKLTRLSKEGSELYKIRDKSLRGVKVYKR